MTAASTEDEELAFGRVALWPRRRVLLADGLPVELGARAFDLLEVLVRADGALVTKETLLDRGWPGVIVEENNLHAQIAAIRRALGPDRDAVLTVAGRGYRLALPVLRRLAVEGARRDGGTLPQLSVVVLPFAGLGGSAGEEQLADSITESLTTDLAQALTGGLVVSRSTAFAYRDRAVTARRIGKELGVRYLLEGSIAAQDDRIRVNAQLIDAVTDTHLWAERFDHPRGIDALAAQDAIVGRLTRMAVLRIVDADARRVGAEAAPDAAGLALRAWAAATAARMSAEGFGAARDMFRHALSLDPDSLEAAAGLAEAEAYAVMNGLTPASEREARLAEAQGLADRVLATRPAHLGALRARAVALRALGQFQRAVLAAEAVLALCPGDPPACREIGLNQLYLGDPEGAVRRFRQADLSGPRDPARWTWMQGLGRALMQLGRDAEAVAALRLAVEGNAAWPRGHALLAAALWLSGEHSEARDHYAEFARRIPDVEARTPSRVSPVPADRVSEGYRRYDARILRALGDLEAGLG
jgi:TolB-like protein/DNA-binding winged helix-turn-helix (wHTH) protein/Flp pilus assembly protein TadD